VRLPFTLRDPPVQANFDKIAAALGEQAFKTSLPLGSGWGNYGGGYETASYSRIGRLVVLQGLVTKTSGTPTAGDLIGVLPAGFRPSGGLLFAVATGETPAVGRVDLSASGNINWTAGASGEADYTALSGIVFVAA
jgi:hypothetical protein